ncbi:unnamed protein product [Cuscuta campestris]|uniref:Uncharacterized protein n=1 Tax=Cuscuta campestris TaxID=132261 RepID=A0A484M865_9ASTE|nr:unnamed protein product [Cuscuta campestris]
MLNVEEVADEAAVAVGIGPGAVASNSAVLGDSSLVTVDCTTTVTLAVDRSLQEDQTARVVDNTTNQVLFKGPCEHGLHSIPSSIPYVVINAVKMCWYGVYSATALQWQPRFTGKGLRPHNEGLQVVCYEGLPIHLRKISGHAGDGGARGAGAAGAC